MNTRGKPAGRMERTSQDFQKRSYVLSSGERIKLSKTAVSFGGYVINKHS